MVGCAYENSCSYCADVAVHACGWVRIRVKGMRVLLGGNGGEEGPSRLMTLSLDLSWLEQKAVAVLLTLLHLGVKNVRMMGWWGWHLGSGGDVWSCGVHGGTPAAGVPTAVHPPLSLRQIRIGPKAPAFLTPESLKVVVDTYGLKVRIGVARWWRTHSRTPLLE